MLLRQATAIAPNFTMTFTMTDIVLDRIQVPKASCVCEDLVYCVIVLQV